MASHLLSVQIYMGIHENSAKIQHDSLIFIGRISVEFLFVVIIPSRIKRHKRTVFQFRNSLLILHGIMRQPHCCLFFRIFLCIEYPSSIKTFSFHVISFPSLIVSGYIFKVCFSDCNLHKNLL